MTTFDGIAVPALRSPYIKHKFYDSDIENILIDIATRNPEACRTLLNNLSSASYSVLQYNSFFDYPVMGTESFYDMIVRLYAPKPK
jgi:hypothetical protein